MTLVLSAATPGFVVQAADRLLTKAVHGRPQPFDPIANKTVVYRATDAFASLSYSGVAYVKTQPTDEWLAELLWGDPIARGPDGNGPAAFGFGARPNTWTIDRAIDALRRAIDGLAQSWINKGGLLVSVAGWRDDRPIRPLVVDIERLPGETRSSVRGTPRRITKPKTFALGQIGARVPWTIMNAAFDPFRPSRTLSMEDAEATLVELIRGAARKHLTVGPNVLTVAIPLPGSGPVVARFHPAIPHRAQFASGRGTFTLTVAHSPWILGSTQFHAPQLKVGRTEINLDGVPFVFEAPPGENGLVGLGFSIKRPKP
jgi:hypothetical protein